jgi:hypothetical protein
MTRTGSNRRISIIAHIVLGMALLSATVAATALRVHPLVKCGGDNCTGSCDPADGGNGACNVNPGNNKCTCFAVE